MIASADCVVSIIYELRKNDEKGEVVEALDYGKPLTFLMGRGNLLPRFEDHLTGLKSGDPFSISLKCEDAYGPLQEAAIVDVPLKIFEVDGRIDTNLLYLGNTIPMMDREGRRINGLVQKIGTDNVTMDFNHPMAGQNLYFKGEVTDVREATPEELEHGHIHAASSCGGCNSESDCGSSSEGGCGCGC